MTQTAEFGLARPAERPALGGRIEVVQALRFFAALAVVGVHLPTLGWGHWGVDLFFVISGFVMCVATERSTRGFMRRRIVRVVPLYWMLTFGVFLVALVAPHLLANSDADAVHLLKSLLFVPFDKNGAGHYPLLFLGWTLNYEMMFYALFALALAVSPRNRVAGASLLVFALYALSSTLATGFPFVVYGDPVILEFCMGMLAYALVFRPEGWRCHALVAAAMVAIGLLLVEPSLDNRAVNAGLACTLVLVAAVAGLGRYPVPATLILLGDASYALYLSHPYVVQGLLAAGLFGAGGPGPAIASLIAVAGCLGLAVLMWLHLDRPIGAWLRRRLP